MRRALAAYQTHARAFCVHSKLWQRLVNHSRSCAGRSALVQMARETTHTPMLRDVADLYYWLYLSPQSHLVTPRPTPADSWSPRWHALYAQLQRDPRAYFRQPVRQPWRTALLRLTTTDQWRRTPAWQALSPWLGVRPELAPTRALTEADRASLDAFLTEQTRPEVRVPFPRADLAQDIAWPVHPLLSLSGPVRVARVTHERAGLRVDQAVAHARAEEFFYWMMKSVCRHTQTPGRGNLAELVK